MNFTENKDSETQGNSEKELGNGVFQRHNLNIWLFNSLFAFSILAAIILSFLSVGRETSKEEGGIPFSRGRAAIRVINIYNLIEYEKMVPHVTSALKSAQESDQVKGIILRINSGGGTVGASHEIYSKVVEFKEKTKKPVIVVMGDLAASGGYYIACSADEILAGPGTLTGSIGVIMTSFTFKGLFEKLGVKQDIIKSGQFKDIGSAIGRDKTPEEINLLQTMISNTYEKFFEVVLNSRKDKKGLDANLLKSYADGRIFTGKQAFDIGLVDKLGGMSDAVKRIQEKLGIKEEMILLEDEKSPLAQLFSLLGSQQSSNPLSITDFLKNKAQGIPLYLYLGDN